MEDKKRNNDVDYIVNGVLAESKTPDDDEARARLEAYKEIAKKAGKRG